MEFFNSHHPDPNEPETEIGEPAELKVYKPVGIGRNSDAHRFLYILSL